MTEGGGSLKSSLSTACNPPSLCHRNAGDTFIELHEYDILEFSEHLNSLDPNFKFTSEIEKDGKTFLGHLRPSRG